MTNTTDQEVTTETSAARRAVLLDFYNAQDAVKRMKTAKANGMTVDVRLIHAAARRLAAANAALRTVGV